LTAVRTAYPAKPLLPFLHPRLQLAIVRPDPCTADAAVVSVRYATIVPMTDADIARDNISRDAYAAVAARRTQFDQLVWQVPVLSLTAQAFLFSIALSPAGTRTTRIIASLLSLVMTFLSLHLMVKHRQAEVADGQWLEAYEKEFPAPVGAPRWPMHGRSWADYRNSIDPNIGRLGGLSKLTGFRIWSWGLSAFGMAAIIVLLLAIFVPGWLGSS
jgi:hypothetical protein